MHTASEKSFYEIKEINQNGITFINGERIVFQACIRQGSNGKTCIAERDLFAQPPYFLFFTADRPTKILFNKKGIFSKSENRKHFRELQRMIIEFGYSSYDLG